MLLQEHFVCNFKRTFTERLPTFRDDPWLKTEARESKTERQWERASEKEKTRLWYPWPGVFLMCLPSQSDCVSSRAHKADLWLGTSGVSWAGHVWKCCLNAPPGGTAPRGLLRLWFLLAAGDLSFILLPVQSYKCHSQPVWSWSRGAADRAAYSKWKLFHLTSEPIIILL